MLNRSLDSKHIFLAYLYHKDIANISIQDKYDLSYKDCIILVIL